MEDQNAKFAGRLDMLIRTQNIILLYFFHMPFFWTAVVINLLPIYYHHDCFTVWEVSIIILYVSCIPVCAVFFTIKLIFK